MKNLRTFCDAWGSQGKVDYAGKPCGDPKPVLQKRPEEGLGCIDS